MDGSPSRPSGVFGMRTDSYVSRGARSAVLVGSFLVTSLASQALSAAPAPVRVRSISPVAGARYVMPRTTLIVRVDPPLTSMDDGLASAFRVSGSTTGLHLGRTLLSRDGRALIFEPFVPFAWGESVEATIDARRRIVTTPQVPRLSFDFTVAPGPSPVHERRPGAGEDPLTRWRSPAAAAPARPAATDSLPADFPEITTTLLGTPAPGWLFLSNMPFSGGATPFLMILDPAGYPRFHRAMPDFCTDFKPQPSGLLTYFDFAAGKYYAMDNTYTVVDSFECGNGYSTDVHELQVLPDGHALLMSYDPQPVDMSLVVPGGDPEATVIGLVIQELDEDKHVVFQWRSWDHFKIIDATREDLTAPVIDYVHGNSIEQDTDGNLLISSRHMDEVTKIDRVTGQMIWRWGGEHNQFTFIDDTLGFRHQHDARRIANGNITLFDNGNYREPALSRAVEYELDEIGFTARLVWEYRHVPDIYGFAMGSAQRLPNGSTLIGWGVGKPDVREVAEDGSVVMELTLPPGQSTYRAFRHEWIAAVTDVAPQPRAARMLTPNVPNPFRGRTELRMDLPAGVAHALGVFDVQGRAVPGALEAMPLGSGQYRVRVDLTGRAAGLYFVRAEAGRRVETVRIVLTN